MQRNSIIREYDDIFQALGEGVLLIIDGVVLQANRSAEELLDWASPLIDRKLHSIGFIVSPPADDVSGEGPQ